VLASSGAISIGVAFEDQYVNKVPAETHDVALDWIITEERARRIQGTSHALGKGI
jgi:5-formyltetrahydrofolate cyclo-ligase